MILTTKTRYAVMAIIEIADIQADRPVSLQEISKRQKISLSYLEQIFANLKKSGIVKSIRGPGGGYVLAINSSEITMAKIVKSIGEPIKITACGNKKKGCVNNNKRCRAHHVWQGLENRIYDYLDSISLKKVCEQ